MSEHVVRTAEDLLGVLDSEGREKLFDFLAVVDHEIRSNTTAITRLADLLLKQLDGQVSEQQMQRFHSIGVAAGRVRGVLDEIWNPVKSST